MIYLYCLPLSPDVISVLLWLVLLTLLVVLALFSLGWFCCLCLLGSTLLFVVALLSIMLESALLRWSTPLFVVGLSIRYSYTLLSMLALSVFINYNKCVNCNECVVPISFINSCVTVILCSTSGLYCSTPVIILPVCILYSTYYIQRR